MLQQTKNLVLGIFALLICFNILAWLVVFDLSRSYFLEVNFFDVGQGDAIFIQTPQRYQILIDGGPDPKIIEKLTQEMPFWDRTIDLIILTHPHRDHMAGLIEVLKRYKVENILWTGVMQETSEYNEWKNLIKNEGAKIFIAHAFQKITTPTTVLNVLYPFENLEGKRVKNINNTSIVSKLVFGEISFLFTGDIYKSVEKKLMKTGIELNAEVLKVSHQGSKTSSSEEFIEVVGPKIAVVQCGKNNKYGHPHLEVLATLEKYGIKVLRTDEQGDIKILSDGKIFKIDTKI